MLDRAFQQMRVDEARSGNLKGFPGRGHSAGIRIMGTGVELRKTKSSSMLLRTTTTRPTALLLGLGVGLWGAFVAQPQKQVAVMLLCFVAAAALLAFATRLPSTQHIPIHNLIASPRRSILLVSICGGVASVTLLWIALGYFRGPGAGHGNAWVLYLLALAVAGASAWPWRGSRKQQTNVPRWEKLALLGILCLAAAPRFYELTTRPSGVWFDEAQNGLEAIRILEEPGYLPVFVSGLSQMPAMPFYYYALFIVLVGKQVLAVRLAMTVAGILSVFCVWLLGRDLFGRRVGLLASALLAICRWHINFSRFGMAILLPALLIPLILYLSLRSQRRHSPRDAVLAGLCLGIGLQSYYVMLSVPVMLILYFLHGLASKPSRSLVAAALLFLMLAMAAFTYSPVLQYALQHPGRFNQRVNTVSLIGTTSPSGLVDLFLTPSARRDETLRKLGGNIVKHLRMFHLEGDRNGRHNLPGAPMLNPMTGLFLAIGFIWCLARVYRPPYALLLLWFGAMISAGILSLDFEAPQGARTFGLTAVIALMAALPLSGVIRWLAEAYQGRSGRRLAIGFAGILLGYGAIQSWTTYFQKQLRDPAVWAAYSTAETKIGRVARLQDRQADLYVPPTLLGGPTETFVLGHPIAALPFERAGSLPLEPRNRKAIVFFDGSEKETASLLQRYYPKVDLEPFGPPRPDGSLGDPILWIARIPAADIDALSNWRIEYRASGQDSVERSTSVSSWDWDDAPVKPPFKARVRGILRIHLDGPYQLFLSGDAPAGLVFDGQPLLSARGQKDRRVVLAQGIHRVELDIQVSGAHQTTSLLWRAPGAARKEQIPGRQMYSPDLSAGGLLGRYYRGLNWQGAPAIRRIDPQIAFYFHRLPVPRPFSVHWSGRIYAPQAGRYRFTTRSIDDSFVRVGGSPLVADRNLNAADGEGLFLEKGWHPIDVWYQAVNNYSQIYLDWSTPAGLRELVPADVLLPPGPVSPGTRLH